MILAEYTVDHPILRRTRTRVPDIEITWVETHTAPDDRRQFIAWVDCDDFEAFETAVHDDPTVTRVEVLSELEGRRMYRFPLTEEGKEADVMPLLAEIGGVHEHLLATSDHWRNRTRFPDRDGFNRVYRFFRSHDIDVTLQRLWEETHLNDGKHHGLTDAQYETLLAAMESGYLDIPRECSLAELGGQLGISESATSERFRRAVKALIGETLDLERSYR
jgi:predicted DNA binding protein